MSQPYLPDPPDAGLDHLVLTAASAAQARGYAAQLRQRHGEGRLRGIHAWHVIADPGDRRVGSGGSSLFVLYELARRLAKERPDARSLAELFADKRILVVHSGGDSRRLIAYAAQGKVFTPLPCDDPASPRHPATLFDLMLAELSKLTLPRRGGVLFAAGDVLLTFDPKAVNFDAAGAGGVVGVAYPGPAERGRNHGVYVADTQTSSGTCGGVADFLQKPDTETARRHHALDAVGRVLVDTGLIALDAHAIARWLAAAGVTMAGKRAKRSRSSPSVSLKPGLLRDVVAGRMPAVDLYEQMLMALPPGLHRRDYLERIHADRLPAAVRRRFEALHRDLHGQAFHVNILPYCEFFHIGSSREMLANVGALSRTSQQFGFANFDRAVVADRAAVEGAFVYHSILTHPSIRAGAGAIVEACHAEQPVELAGRNLLVGLPSQASAAKRAGRTKQESLQLPEGWGLVCLPVGRRDDWTAVLLGIDDDFKTPLARGGTLGNLPLLDWLERLGAGVADLWPQGGEAEQTLWNARLWSVGSLRDVLRRTLWMCHDGPPPRSWRQARRWSAPQLIAAVDHDRLLAHRREVQRRYELHHLDEALTGDPWRPAAEVAALARDADEARDLAQRLAAIQARSADPLLRARVLQLQAVLAARSSSPARVAQLRVTQLQAAALREVTAAVAQQVALPDKPRPAAVLPDQAVWVTTPVRIDFAGGWSDTPPICTEMGGCVLNAAVTLNGQYPVQVVAKLNDQRRAITISSIDLAQSITLAKTSDALDYRDPRHWAALPKAALVLAGIVPSDPKQSLSKWLDTLGGGIDITLFSALPKGSGMGTSSILGAAMLAGLGRVLGQPFDRDDLIARTSVLEQLMTTGGGWQDQVGGITPGIKLTTTSPGAMQSPAIQRVASDPTASAELRGRLLLYFTGHKRMARDILQKVVGRYLARDPQAIRIVHALKDDAQRMKHDLDAGDFDAFAAGVDRYWRLKQQFDPGSTNPHIESLLKPLQRDLIARLLPGAGGGGFVFMIARDAAAAARIRDRLDRRPPNPLARFFDFQIDPHGLRVTVL